MKRSFVSSSRTVVSKDSHHQRFVIIIDEVLREEVWFIANLARMFAGVSHNIGARHGGSPSQLPVWKHHLGVATGNDNTLARQSRVIYGRRQERDV